jgi:hypothetical protein
MYFHAYWVTKRRPDADVFPEPRKSRYCFRHLLAMFLPSRVTARETIVCCYYVTAYMSKMDDAFAAMGVGRGSTSSDTR